MIEKVAETWSWTEHATSWEIVGMIAFVLLIAACAFSIIQVISTETRSGRLIYVPIKKLKASRVIAGAAVAAIILGYGANIVVEKIQSPDMKHVVKAEYIEITDAKLAEKPTVGSRSLLSDSPTELLTRIEGHETYLVSLGGDDEITRFYDTSELKVEKLYCETTQSDKRLNCYLSKDDVPSTHTSSVPDNAGHKVSRERL